MSEATPNRSAQSWQARIGDEKVEFAEIGALRKLVTEGRLRPEHYVYHPSSQRWMYAREVPELRDSFAAGEIAANPTSWIVQTEGSNYPLPDLDAIRSWIHEGRIRRGTLLRHPVLERWMRAADVLEIAPDLQQQPDTSLKPAPRSSAMTPQTVGVIALVAVVLLLAAIGIYRGTLTPREAEVATSAPAGATTSAATETAAAKPKMITWLFGESEKSETAETSTSSDTTATATTTDTAAEEKPADSGATATETVAETPQPKRDDAESLYEDESGELRVQPTVTGDMRVMVDRSHVDPHYHLPRCPNVTAEMTGVSLDLARQGYTPCPVCKPPR